jgi:NAD(P)H-hydrate epimerase
VKLVTAAQMRAIESACAERGITTDQLMDAAGLAVAQEGWISLGVLIDRVVVLLCGPGNNGGDALVATRSLREWGADVRLYLVGDRPDNDPRLAAARDAGATVLRQSDDSAGEQLRTWLAEADLVIDAILGTGQRLPLRDNVRSVLAALGAAREQHPRPRLVAVDVPTGVDADSGEADENAVEADGTVALGFAKVGLYNLPGSRFTGRIEVVDIGIPADLAADVKLELLDRRWARSHVPARPSDANKGSFGRVLVVAGAPEYPGAAYLVCRGAGRAGAGLVSLAASPYVAAVVAGRSPETTYTILQPEADAEAHSRMIMESAASADALVIGPGLSQRREIAVTVEAVLRSLPANIQAVVIDADALNALAKLPDWPRLLPPVAVLTPHPGEMSRLMGVPVADIQAARAQATMDASAAWGVAVVLKGSNTVIAAPDGRVQLAPFANAALATAGTGDVLAGIIGGLAAQGVSPFEAAVLGVYLHGKAGETLADEMGSAGVLAGDVADAIPRVLKLLATEG